ncbi:uncharacterized protein LOC128959711 [Oppia nitens]|uniref:uncharacterized protein LOC128959711 n=1 Tax=Oppia nitens TaxID=1686743 RepID=UPI0023DBD265|nr:uncharacterized protein LOC128959711 [Oppia nitens]
MDDVSVNGISSNHTNSDTNNDSNDGKHQKQHQQHRQQQQSDIKLFDDPRTPRILMRILFPLWFGIYLMVETMFLRFAVTYYQYSPHRLSATEAGYMFTIDTAVYSVARFVITFLSMYLSVNTMVVTHYSLLVVAIVLLVIGHWHLTVLWVATCTVMVAFAPLYAACYSFTAQYLTMTNKLSNGFLFCRVYQI